MACALGSRQMRIENSAMAAWFDKSDVYSAFNSEVQTMIIKTRKSGKWKGERKKKDYNEEEQILNNNKQ